MADSDDEYDRKRRDKFRGERSSGDNYRSDRRGGDDRGRGREDWNDRYYYYIFYLNISFVGKLYVYIYSMDKTK